MRSGPGTCGTVRALVHFRLRDSTGKGKEIRTLCGILSKEQVGMWWEMKWKRRWWPGCGVLTCLDFNSEALGGGKALSGLKQRTGIKTVEVGLGMFVRWGEDREQ